MIGPLNAGSQGAADAPFQVGGLPWGPRLVRDLLVYGLGGSAAKVINAFLLPVFTRILTPTEFGAIDLFTSVASIVMVVGGLGLEAALIYFYARSDDAAEQKVIASTTLAIALAGTSIVSLIAVVGEPLLRSISGSSELSSAYILTLVYVPISLSSGIVLDVLRLEFRSRAYAVISFLRAIGTAVFAIAIVVVTGTGVAGYVASQIAIAALSIAAGVLLVHRSFSVRPSVAMLRRLLRYGLPFVPLGITAWILAWSDRVFLAGYGYVGDLGYYAAANRLAQLTFLVVLALQTAWTPFAITASRDPGHRRAFVVVFRLVACGLLAAVAVTSVVAGPVVAFALPVEYRASIPEVPLLAGAIAAQGMSGVVAVGLLLTERTGRLAIIGVLTAISNVLFNIIAIPPLGIVGAAAATFGSSVISLILIYVASERAYPIGYPGGRFIVASALVGIGIAIVLPAISTGSQVDGLNVWWALRASLAVILTVMAALVLGMRPYIVRARAAVAASVGGLRAKWER